MPYSLTEIPEKTKTLQETWSGRNSAIDEAETVLLGHYDNDVGGVAPNEVGENTYKMPGPPPHCGCQWRLPRLFAPTTPTTSRHALHARRNLPIIRCYAIGLQVDRRTHLDAEKLLQSVLYTAVIATNTAS